MGCIIRFAIVVILFLCLVAAARSHEAHKGWEYPYECCHDKDCAEISETRVKPIAGGYIVDGKHQVAQKDVRQSPDGRFHACFPTPELLRCFFAPPPGS